jgi:hypothetical protein
MVDFPNPELPRRMISLVSGLPVGAISAPGSLFSIRPTGFGPGASAIATSRPGVGEGEPGVVLRDHHAVLEPLACPIAGLAGFVAEVGGLDGQAREFVAGGVPGADVLDEAVDEVRAGGPVPGRAELRALLLAASLRKGW